MTTAIYIYSMQALSEPRGGLEDDLDELLGDAGTVTGGGSGETGWNVDPEINDGIPVHDWIEKLCAFLRAWGVPNDTHFMIAPADGAMSTIQHRVDVFHSRTI